MLLTIDFDAYLTLFGARQHFESLMHRTMKFLICKQHRRDQEMAVDQDSRVIPTLQQPTEPEEQLLDKPFHILQIPICPMAALLQLTIQEGRQCLRLKLTSYVPIYGKMNLA